MLGLARSVPDQEQADKVEKRFLFGIVDLKSFEPQRDSIEQFLIADPNSNQRGIYGAYVTTHRISARTLAQVQKVCRMRFSPTLFCLGREDGGENLTTDFSDYTD